MVVTVLEVIIVVENGYGEREEVVGSVRCRSVGHERCQLRRHHYG